MAFVTPAEPLEPGITYVLTANGLRDDAGQTYSSYTVSFTTAAIPSAPNNEDDLGSIPDLYVKGLDKTP